jgi:uncharacterized protein (TIGR03435 family)
MIERMTARLCRSFTLILAVGCMFIVIPIVLSQAPAPQAAAGTSTPETAPKLPEFEVASVKPSNPNAQGAIGLFTYPGGRVVASNCTLPYLISETFHVQGFQVAGGPNWMSEARFDIEAKPPVSSLSGKSNPASFKDPPSDEQRQMLQALLIDRFQLKFHRELRQGSVYILRRGDKPLKLENPKDKNAYSWAGSIEGGDVTHGTGLAGINISMSQLAVRLSGSLGRPVLDQTGLQGSFDFNYETGNDDSDASPTASIFTSLRAIGLDLKPAKGPVEFIIIDSVEKPSAN